MGEFLIRWLEPSEMGYPTPEQRAELPNAAAPDEAWSGWIPCSAENLLLVVIDCARVGLEAKP